MSVFDVDIPAVITANVPARLRQPVMTAWLRCLCTPVVYLYDLFSQNRVANLYYLGHSGQVCFIEAALNDVFDPLLRRISIADPPYFDAISLFLEAEIPPQVALSLFLVSETVPAGAVALLPLYLDAEVGIDDNCFMVMVPSALALSPGQFAHLRAVVDRYRLPGKNSYGIVSF